MSRVFIIAEAGINHNGDIECALHLCDAARHAQVDAIKFQTFKTEKLLTRKASMAPYQKQNLGEDVSQFEMAKKLELSYTDFEKIKHYCDKIGLLFLSTPDEEESLDFLATMDVNPLKVGSGEITNIPFLRRVGRKNRDVILSTGMSCLGEIEKAYSVLMESGVLSVALLHCTSNYPCPMEEVNLKAMKTMAKVFDVRVGYSDHTQGIEVPIAAVAMGATIIEKHFTLDKNMQGPDHRASLEPHELKAMVHAIRNIEKALGNGIKKPSPSELKNKPIVRKSIVAVRSIRKGEVFTEENLAVKRPGDGISPMRWDEIIGKISSKDYFEDELIEP